MGAAVLRFLHWLRRGLKWVSGRSEKDARAELRRGLDKRRALRLPVAMHVLLYGRRGDAPFTENAEMVDVSTLGGLVPISARVHRSQRLILTNLQTNEEVTCRVARLTKAEDGRKLIGLAFLQPGPRFWRAGPYGDLPYAR